MACRASQFWATKLDVYRRSPASTIFGALSVLGLFVYAVFVFTFVNMAAYKIDPAQYSYEREPSLAIFAYYAFSAATGSEISALSPVGGVAALIQVAAGFLSAIVLLLMVFALIFGIKQSRVDQSAVESIGKIREAASDFEERLGDEYEATPQELFERLVGLSDAFARALVFLSREMPDEPARRAGS